MKFLIFLLLFPCPGIAQKKGTNSIVIENTNKAQAVKVFRNNGYEIDIANKREVSTLPKMVSGHLIAFRIKLEGADNYLFGTCDGNDIISTLTDSDPGVGKLNNPPFTTMDSLAKAFGKPITYFTAM